MRKILREGIDDYRNKYSDIPDNIFDELLSLDPTYKSGVDDIGIYSEWLFKQFQNKNITERDFARIPSLLAAAEKYKDSSFDINRYNSLSDLKDELIKLKDIFDNDDKNIENDFKKYDRVNLRDMADLVLDGEYWQIWIPRTHAAFVRLGKNTNWAVAEPNANGRAHYNEMAKLGPTYICKNKKYFNELYLINLDYTNDKGLVMDGYGNSCDLYEIIHRYDNKDLSPFFMKILNKRLNDVSTKLYSKNGTSVYKTNNEDILKYYGVDTYYMPDREDKNTDYILITFSNSYETFVFILSDLVLYDARDISDFSSTVFSDLFSEDANLKPFITDLILKSLKDSCKEINDDGSFTTTVKADDFISDLDCSDSDFDADVITDLLRGDWNNALGDSYVDNIEYFDGFADDISEEDFNPSALNSLSKLGLTVQDFKDIWDGNREEDFDEKVYNHVREAIRQALSEAVTVSILNNAYHLLINSVEDATGCSMDNSNYPNIEFSGNINKLLDSYFNAKSITDDYSGDIKTVGQLIRYTLVNFTYKIPYYGFEDYIDDNVFYRSLDEYLLEDD